MRSSGSRVSGRLWCCALLLAGLLFAGPVVASASHRGAHLVVDATPDTAVRSQPVDPVLLSSARRDEGVSRGAGLRATSSAPPPPPSQAPPSTEPPSPPPTTRAPAPFRLEVPTVPGGAVLVDRLGSDHSRRVAADALTLIRFDWATALPGWQLRLLDGRSGYRGMTYPYEQVVEVYVRTGDTPAVLAHVIAHEFGHAVDVTLLDDGDRARWSAARGHRAGTPWWVSVGGNDFASGSGDFAESFAWWQTPGGHWYSRLGPPPSPLQLGVLGELSGRS